MDTRGDYQHLQSLYLPIGAGVVVVVVLIVVFAALRWRERGGPRRRSRRTDAPRLEAAYALALVAIAALLVAATFRTEDREDPLSRHPRLDVVVTAAQWNWRFDYRSLGISVVGTNTVPPTLTLPENESVRFTMRSQDVIHAFWIPSLRFKRDAFPRRTTRFDMRFEHAGFLSGAGACAEYCGLRHGDMRFAVQVLSASDFATWARNRRAAAGGSP